MNEPDETNLEDDTLVRHVEIYREPGGTTASASGPIELKHDGDWRWRAVAGNGKIVAVSGEGYANRGDLIDVVARLFPGVPHRDPEAPESAE